MIQHKLFYQDPVQTPVMLLHVSDTPILEKDILRTWLNVKPGTLIKDLKGNSILSKFLQRVKKKMGRLVSS